VDRYRTGSDYLGAEQTEVQIHPLQLQDLNFMNELNEIFQACNQDFAAQFTATWSCIKGQNRIY